MSLGSRRGHLEVICPRLQQEDRLEAGLSPEVAARIAFALTTPYVYEAQLVQGGLATSDADGWVVDAATAAVIDLGTPPVSSDAID